MTPRKEHDVTTHKRHFPLWLAAALAFAALSVPVAQAGPDDRALDRSTSAVAAQQSVSPDDRPLIRSSVALEPRSVGPDDRADYRGTSVDQPAAAINVASMSPDDRSLARSTGFIATSVPVSAALTSADGFDWQEAALGAGFGMLVASLVLGALLVRQGRRGTLEPA
jgi:hypothetical protein